MAWPVRHHGQVPVRRSASVLAGLVLAALLSAPTSATVAIKAPAATARLAPSAVAEPLIEPVVIGESVLGRPIVAVHRWRPGATRTLLAIGNIHGDEQAGLRVVDRLLTHSLPAAVNLWVIRSANPDGTAADRRTNADGVDLNRNFPRRWVRAGGGTSNWSGPRAASEPETQVLLRFVAWIQPHTTIVFHQPLDGVDSYRAKSMTLVRRLASASGLPVKSFDCHGGCHGTFTDWLNTRTPGRAVTVELGVRASGAQVARLKRAVLTVAQPPSPNPSSQ
jgi:murein peptide amidase A